jgi:hypothetical protein
MDKAIWHFDINPNIGVIDKAIRYVVGATLIGTMLAIETTPVGWLVILPLVAIPVFISAFLGWDPIYALFQKRPIKKFSFFNKRPSA